MIFFMVNKLQMLNSFSVSSVPAINSYTVSGVVVGTGGTVFRHFYVHSPKDNYLNAESDLIDLSNPPSEGDYIPKINPDELTKLNPNWITGFTDAEGSFYVSIYKDKNLSLLAHNSRTYTTSTLRTCYVVGLRPWFIRGGGVADAESCFTIRIIPNKKYSTG